MVQFTTIMLPDLKTSRIGHQPEIQALPETRRDILSRRPDLMLGGFSNTPYVSLCSLNRLLFSLNSVDEHVIRSQNRSGGNPIFGLPQIGGAELIGLVHQLSIAKPGYPLAFLGKARARDEAGLNTENTIVANVCDGVTEITIAKNRGIPHQIVQAELDELIQVIDARIPTLKENYVGIRVGPNRAVPADKLAIALEAAQNQWKYAGSLIQNLDFACFASPLVTELPSERFQQNYASLLKDIQDIQTSAYAIDLFQAICCDPKIGVYLLQFLASPTLRQSLGIESSDPLPNQKWFKNMQPFFRRVAKISGGNPDKVSDTKGTVSEGGRNAETLACICTIIEASTNRIGHTWVADSTDLHNSGVVVGIRLSGREIHELAANIPQLLTIPMEGSQKYPAQPICACDALPNASYLITVGASTDLTTCAPVFVNEILRSYTNLVWGKSDTSPLVTYAPDFDLVGLKPKIRKGRRNNRAGTLQGVNKEVKDKIIYGSTNPKPIERAKPVVVKTEAAPTEPPTYYLDHCFRPQLTANEKLVELVAVFRRAEQSCLIRVKPDGQTLALINYEEVPNPVISLGCWVDQVGVVRHNSFQYVWKDNFAIVPGIKASDCIACIKLGNGSLLTVHIDKDSSDTLLPTINSALQTIPHTANGDAEIPPSKIVSITLVSSDPRLLGKNAKAAIQQGCVSQEELTSFTAPQSASDLRLWIYNADKSEGSRAHVLMTQDRRRSLTDEERETFIKTGMSPDEEPLPLIIKSIY